MLLSWLEDDITSERTHHSNAADAVAIAACLIAALILHHHAPETRDRPFSIASAPHALFLHHQAHSRRA